MRYKYLPLLLALTIFSLVITACTSLTSGYKNNRHKKTFQQKTFAIKNVNIIPMTPGGEVLLDATVIIESGKIRSINELIPKDAEIINGKGKWLIPELIDAHVHNPTDGRLNTTYPTKVSAIFTNTQDVMLPFVANGVTTVFELISKAGHFGQRNEIARGDVIGPRMALAASINGGKGSNMIANTPTHGRQSVRNAKSEGYELIKVYSELNIETYNAVVDEARKQGLKVVGHIPNAFKGKIEKAYFLSF